MPRPVTAEADRRAIETFGEALEGSDRPLVIASGTLGLAPGRVATEGDGRDPDATPPALIGGAHARLANAHLTLALASRGVRSAVLRLPPTVHGNGDHGFVATLVNIARDKGVSGYLGDGSNRWSAVHRTDAASLFRLAVESAPAASTLHAIGDEGVPIREVAEVIGRHLGVPVRAIAPDDAASHFTWLANFIGVDSPSSSALTREMLGWQPTNIGLIADLDQGHYFDAPPRQPGHRTTRTRRPVDVAGMPCPCSSRATTCRPGGSLSNSGANCPAVPNPGCTGTSGRLGHRPSVSARRTVTSSRTSASGSGVSIAKCSELLVPPYSPAPRTRRSTEPLCGRYARCLVNAPKPATTLPCTRNAGSRYEMHSFASGTTRRMVSRSALKVPRAGSSTPSR
jgi:hypothetical protein